MDAGRNPSDVPITAGLYEKATACRIPLSGTFELSPVCNLHCRMCYIRKSQQEVASSPRAIMTLEQWLTVAREARSAGLLELLLTGGEPLLWPDFWPLYEQLIRMGFLVSVNTNGSLIREEDAERFRRLPPKRINITLYGASDRTYQALCGASGVYDRVISAVGILTRAGIPVKLNCSVTPYNVQDLEAVFQFARERSLPLDATAYMFPPVRRDLTQVGSNLGRFSPEETAACQLKIYRLENGEEAYRKLLEQLLTGTASPPGLDAHCPDPVDGHVRCRAGKASFWITWDGWMTPCGMMNEPKCSVAESGFDAAWASITEQTAALRLSGRCRRCPSLRSCHPCAAIALAETGHVSGVPEYLCRISRELVRLARQDTTL